MEYPEIARTLVYLGMVKDVAFGCDQVKITLVLPCLWVPIRDYLVYSLREAVEGLGIEAEVTPIEMSQEERESFMQKVSESWRG